VPTSELYPALMAVPPKAPAVPIAAFNAALELSPSVVLPNFHYPPKAYLFDGLVKYVILLILNLYLYKGT